MKIRELIFHPPLKENDNRTKEDLLWLLNDKFNYDYQKILLSYDQEIDDEEFFSYWDKLEETPIQYLLGYGYFLGNKLYVNENVLIPRNETEELVMLIKDKVKDYKDIKVLDIGTGSGAIILTLEMLLKKMDINFKGVGGDISPLALEVAHVNKTKFNLETRFIESDVYENINEKFDLIVSNPPYIKEDEFVEDRVKNKEPYIALYAKNDGLEIYEKIIKDASMHLNKNGILAFEISPERKEGLAKLIDKYLNYRSYEVIKDINNFDRFLFVYLKG